jgi:phage terminase Nu1 subunit (DNA packaging protein)
LENKKSYPQVFNKKMAEKELLSTTQYAEYKGVHHKTISYHAIKGNLPFIKKNGQRLFDPEVADKAWETNIKNNLNESSDDDGAAPTGKAAHETRLKKAQADKAEIELKKLKGELLDKNEVKDQITTCVRQARDAFRALPQKIAPELAAEVDPYKVETMMLTEIDQVLDELATLADKYD